MANILTENKKQSNIAIQDQEVSLQDNNESSVNIIMDKKNNICMPMFANTVNVQKNAKGLAEIDSWDGMGNVFCQTDDFPINAFWGNIPYGIVTNKVSETGGKTSVTLPNAPLFD